MRLFEELYLRGDTSYFYESRENDERYIKYEYKDLKYKAFVT